MQYRDFILMTRGVGLLALRAEWRVLPSVQGGVDLEDRFVWQKGGRDAYHQLMNNYLKPPGWNVRFARFEGDVVERAEEYNVAIVRDGQVIRVQHQLPESAPGPSLAEDAARQIARQAVESYFHLAPTSLREVSAVASKVPKRSDWARASSSCPPPPRA